MRNFATTMLPDQSSSESTQSMIGWKEVMWNIESILIVD